MSILARFKKVFLYVLIGALIVSALVAIVTVLLGEFTTTSGRVLLTLLMVVLHAFLSLAFIWEDERKRTFTKLSFFTNTLFVLIVMSFITSVFGVWKIFDEEITGDLYLTYLLIGFSALHYDALSKAVRRGFSLDKIIAVNYIFIALVLCMVLPLILLVDPQKTLGDVYYRILGAVGIVDGTLTVLSIIFFRMYQQKYPEEQQLVEGGKKRGMSGWLWLLIIIFALLFIPGLLWQAFYLFTK